MTPSSAQYILQTGFKANYFVGGKGDRIVTSKLFIIGSAFTYAATHGAAPLNNEVLRSIQPTDTTIWDDLTALLSEFHQGQKEHLHHKSGCMAAIFTFDPSSIESLAKKRASMYVTRTGVNQSRRAESEIFCLR